ncbi:MAG: hypothetical protein ABI165_07330 [Bryobacteraceae bacterium]
MTETATEGGLGATTTNKTTTEAVSVRSIAAAKPVPGPGLLGGGKTTQQHPAYGRIPVNPRRFEPPSDFWLPDWARTLVDQNATPEQVIRAAIDRVVKGHSEQTLVEAQTVINELSRSVDHAKIVTTVLTRETLNPLLARKA